MNESKNKIIYEDEGGEKENNQELEEGECTQDEPLNVAVAQIIDANGNIKFVTTNNYNKEAGVLEIETNYIKTNRIKKVHVRSSDCRIQTQSVPQPEITQTETKVGKKKKRNRKKKKDKTKVIKIKTPICKFYQEGRCKRGTDCEFLHDGPLKHKLEPCKFYLRDGVCLKGEGCVYMHEGFPCKFFHWGSCRDGVNCRFYHGELSDELKEALEKHIKSTSETKENENIDKKIEQESKVNLF